MKICAVIPAAGRGSRLGGDVPKILLPVAGETTVWTILRDRLRPLVDTIHVVLSASALPAFTAALTDADHGQVTTSVQAAPRGMGDAIFGARRFWEPAATIVIVWGDQIHVSTETLRTSLALQGGRPRSIGLPLVALPAPYVEYRFDADGRLIEILQLREGDRCRAGGLGDVGTFVLSTEGLAKSWDDYVAAAPRGRQTGEINFLPFLVFLARHGWTVRQHRATDTNEARGINTLDDLAFFRSLYARGHAADLRNSGSRANA